ncbi:MAG: hypothetical protein K0S20_32 [Patescibacteria group bacterium]|jgi:hypothetical protein|nr:hypothetical protein [Patescibacteria group bacterium]
MIVRKQATLDHFDGKQAVLLLENGQELCILKEELGAALSEGDIFTVQILPEQEAALEKNELARTLLNQLLDEKTDS